MRRLFLILLVILLLIPSAFAAVELVGSKNSDIYHLPDCPFAQRISESNRITFDSADEARWSGYRPCSTCNPDNPNASDAKTNSGLGTGALSQAQSDGYGKGYAEGYDTGYSAGLNYGTQSAQAEHNRILASRLHSNTTTWILISILALLTGSAIGYTIHYIFARHKEK